MLKPQASGFTLIELMIVVAIIGILAAIAYPSYQGYIDKTACEDARATLMTAVSDMERYRAGHNGYAGAVAGTNIPNRSPASGVKKYTIAFAGAPTVSGYTLRAVPTGSGKTITLTNYGQRTNWECR